MQQQQADKPVPLPPLRTDLVFANAGFDATGEPGLVIHDPVRHRYFRLAQRFKPLFDVWHLGTAQDVAIASACDIADVEGLRDFLVQSHLVLPSHGLAQSLIDERRRSQKSWASQALHSYLMFRIPLFNPEPFLDWALPAARVLATRTVLMLVILMALCGLYFASRQCDHFTNTFFDFLTLQGVALYGVTLVGLKILHELGHGFVARHFGVRVPVMGISFMILVPMLYTEASDAWRLSSRRQRFLIGAAGVMVELSLAAMALLLWAFLPDGPWRSVAFFVASTAWIMSLLVNLSPFMRFDGYHMLVDASGLHSIGPRAFALAQWHLLEMLFKPDQAPPEIMPRNMRRALIAFAWGTWLYRLSLFLGIAWLVYTMFPKAAGLPLAYIEIHVFLLMPIIRTLKEWNKMGWRSLLRTRRSVVSMAVLAGGAVLACLPLQRHVSVPAILLPAQESRIFSPEPAQVVEIKVRPGQSVAAGDVLARLTVPEIAHHQRLVQLRLEIVELQLRRLATDARDLAQSQVLQRERAALLQELDGLKSRNQRLVVIAPHDGMIAGRDQTFQPGQWVGHDQILAHVVKHDAPARIEGLIGERDSSRLKNRTAAVFVSEDGMSPAITARVKGLGIPGSEGLLLAYLAAEAGGPVLMAKDTVQGQRRPMNGHIPIYMSVEVPAPAIVLRGTATVEIEPQSFAALAMGRLVTVFLRESGF